MSSFPNQPVDDALRTVREAQMAAHAVIKAQYPVGANVTVHHYHGSFAAIVTGYDVNDWCFYGLGRVLVRNTSTGKTSKRSYDDLEVL